MKFIVATIFLISLYQLPEKICKFYNFKINIVQRYFGIALILSFIYLINIYFLIFFSNSKFLNIFIFLLILIYGFKIQDIKIKFIKIIDFLKKEKNNKSEILIVIILILYFLISFIPLSDLDSLRYHMWLPKQIINHNFTSYITFDYLFFGANEIINLFSLNLNFENFSSNINFLYLLAFYQCFNWYKEKKLIQNNIYILIFFSIPYFISLISSQKLFLLPVFISSFSILYFFINYRKIGKIELIILDTLFFFIVCIKITFLPYLILYFLIKNFYLKNNFKENCLIYFILSIIFIFPLIWFKFIFFGEPLIPFYVLNKANLEWYTPFKNYVLTYGYSNYFFLNFLKIFVPFNLSEIFQTLFPSIIALFFINIKKNIKLTFVLFIFFLIPILIFKNFQSRWFLPTIPLIAILYDTQNRYHNIVKKLLILFLIFKIFILIPIALISFTSTISEKNKNIFLRNFSYGFEVAEFLKKEYPNQKIISNIQNFYYINEIIPIYSQELDKNLIDQISFKKNFFSMNLKNDEKFIIVLLDNKYSANEIKDKFNLQNIKILKNYNKNFEFSGRNFLIKSKSSITIFECLMKR